MDQQDPRILEAEQLTAVARWREAATAYAELIAAGATGYHIHSRYGMVLAHCNQNEAAREQLETALRYQPESIEVLNNLAATLLKLGRARAAEDICRRILAEQPDHHAAWSNLGITLCNQGRVPAGIEALERALELAPGDRIIGDNLLLNLNYIATDGRDLADVHRLLCADYPSPPRRNPPLVAGRRIRIGYLSNDFRSHSVSFFMPSILGTHDRNAFEVFCYSTTHASDGRTEGFRQLTEHFVDLSTQSDVEAAQRIEADGIDILIDLGGHTAGNRLGIFALRPAPVQVTYLGYPATTGCAFMDFRLVDSLTDPPGSEPFSTERLVRLPAPFLCYTPHTTFPPTAPVPALANGHVTFGSFNHGSKISEDTLDLWSRVLAAVPESRMFIKSREFSDADIRADCQERFASRGIDPSRLTFSGLLQGAQDHLAAYGRIDIALDTFPYNGTTTTCEALWMGVPVISLVGDLHAARVGHTILNAVGLGGLATSSADEYTALARALSSDLAQLAKGRAQLQKAVANSPLCDRFRMTRGLEGAFRTMVDPGG